jgi:prepilin-type N-terminal cleavage/methylation domain-containing protein
MSNATRNGFTLIEVMVAVMIVSVVIGAIWKMQGDATQKLLGLDAMTQKLHYNSFLLGETKKYGFEKSTITLYTLVADFDIPTDLRRELKSMKLNIEYNTKEVIDTNESVILEVGQTVLKIDGMQSQLVRVRLQ